MTSPSNEIDKRLTQKEFQEAIRSTKDDAAYHDSDPHPSSPNMEHDDYDDESSSPEAAGVARGAAKTATSLSGRAAIGRLPKARTPMPKPSAPRISGIRIPKAVNKAVNKVKVKTNINVNAKVNVGSNIPIKRVAKLSDRISTGFDAYDAATESASSSSSDNTTRATSDKTGRNKSANDGNDGKKAVGSSDGNGGTAAGVKTRLTMLANRAIQFSGTLLKNTVMGAGAFETFDKTIEYLDKIEKSAGINDNHNMDHNAHMKMDVYARAPLSHHFAAGMAGGSVHSALFLTFQSMAYLKELKENKWKNIYSHSHSHPSPAGTFGQAGVTVPVSRSLTMWSIFNTFHHGISHALLFSSYEGLKRLAFHSSNLHANADNGHDHEDGGNHSTVGDTLKIGLVGGLAGQIQHVASHYTESYLHVGEEVNGRTYWQQQHRPTLTLSALNKLFVGGMGPSVRSTLLAFPPSAIGFIAFEFGKEFISD